MDAIITAAACAWLFSPVLVALLVDSGKRTRDRARRCGGLRFVNA